MSNQTLRELAKDYAKGVISQEQYRKTRRALIKGIVAGDIPVKEIDFLPLLKPTKNDEITESKTRPRDKSTTQINYQSIPAKKPDKKTPFLFIGISTATVIILVIGIIFFFYFESPEQPKTDITPTNNVAGETLITEFLTEKNWRKERIDQFISSWSALTLEEKNAASEIKRMQRLHDSIYKQFLEEKALIGINSEKAINNQKKLIEFAEAIGISDPRLVLH